MADIFPLSGKLEEISLPRILNHISRQYMDGELRILSGDECVTAAIQDRMVRYVCVKGANAPLGTWLLNRGELDESELHQAREIMEKKGVRFGRAMMLLGKWTPVILWERVTLFQAESLYHSFDLCDGTYEMVTDAKPERENITLDLSLHRIIAGGVRRMRNMAIVRREMAGVERLYPGRTRMPVDFEIQAHEHHVQELVRRETEISRIMSESELLPDETLRVLFMLLAAERISIHPPEEPDMERAPGKTVTASTFNSFDDALKYYNQKYEMVFRVLSKEIGPIALSILQKAIQGVMDDLPSCFRKVTLRSGGGLEEDPILKSVWYQDFDRTIGEFLRGLEEILYAQIFAVKRHLGVEFEQQILTWLNRIDN